MHKLENTRYFLQVCHSINSTLFIQVCLNAMLKDDSNKVKLQQKYSTKTIKLVNVQLPNNISKCNKVYTQIVVVDNSKDALLDRVCDLFWVLIIMDAPIYQYMGYCYIYVGARIKWNTFFIC